MKKIPVTNRKKEVVAYALVDDCDVYLASFRWHLHTVGYATHGINHTLLTGTKNVKKVSMHRVILGLMWGDPRQGDHINGNKLDNRRHNLRIVTVQQQRQNVRAGYGTSKYRGVRRLAN